MLHRYRRQTQRTRPALHISIPLTSNLWASGYGLEVDSTVSPFFYLRAQIGSISTLYILCKLLAAKMPSAAVPALLEQRDGLKIVQNVGDRISIPSQPTRQKTIDAVVIADDGKRIDSGPLFFTAGLLLGLLSRDSPFHILSMNFHKLNLWV